MIETLKVLVVDDSVIYRKSLSDIINSRTDMELVGTASNGKLALSKIEIKKPDLVILDVEMPEMNGLEVLEAIKRDHRGIDVVFISGTGQNNAKFTVKALELGALDFVPKPKGETAQSSLLQLESALVPLLELAKTRKYLSHAKDNARGGVIDERKVSLKLQEKDGGGSRQSLVLSGHQRSPSVESTKLSKIDAIAIGVSTGGPNALNRIIPKLDADLPIPVLVVQHMPPTFTATLAESLDQISKIKVVEAAAGMKIEKGVLYLAPGGFHMVVRQGSDGEKTIGITSSAPVHNCRPAVDVLFRSMAVSYGKKVLSLILTGMGSDGTAGVSAIRRKGGYCIVQDEESSVVWGMPGSVNAAGEADEIVSLDKIPQRIKMLVGDKTEGLSSEY